jgi:hypothetical protein
MTRPPCPMMLTGMSSHPSQRWRFVVDHAYHRLCAFGGVTRTSTEGKQRSPCSGAVVPTVHFRLVSGSPLAMHRLHPAASETASELIDDHAGSLCLARPGDSMEATMRSIPFQHRSLSPAETRVGGRQQWCGRLQRPELLICRLQRRHGPGVSGRCPQQCPPSVPIVSPAAGHGSARSEPQSLSDLRH